MSEAFDAGVAAAAAGEARKAPHDGRTAEARDWYSGFDSYAPPPPRAGPGESSNPDVQYLIANRRAHEIALADPDVTPENRKSAEDGIAAINRRLAEEFGY